MDVREQRVRFVVEATQKRRPFGALCAAYEIPGPRDTCGCGASGSKEWRASPSAAAGLIIVHAAPAANWSGR